MAKVNQKTEVLAKPKFQQTRLCFAPASSPSTIIKKRDNYAEKLEQEILDLKITIDQEPNEHEDLCKECDKSRPRVHCTALKQNSTEPCNYSFCDKCIKKWINEDLKWIKSNKDDYCYQNGETVQHRETDSQQLKWACLVCRGLCQCGFCSKQRLIPPPPTTSSPKKQKSAASFFFNMMPIKLVDPPELEQLTMMYSEDELWLRLRIREFVFRFADVFGWDGRIMSYLQNAQGDWKIKKFGAYLVYQILVALSKATEFDPPLTSAPTVTIPQKAKETLEEWIKEKRLTKYYLDNQSRNQVLLDILATEGMTVKRWQDVAEILALAEYPDIPVPTYPKKKENNANYQNDDDAMDIDDEEELVKQVERFRKPVRNTILLPPQSELNLLYMLMELLLHHTQTRQSLSVPTHTGYASKEVHDAVLDLKKFIKEYNIEETSNKSKRYKLTTRINQLTAVRGKREELKAAQIELDQLETLIRDERMDLEKRKIELYITNAKSQKRLTSAGVDILGNEYWIFNDLLDHLAYASDYRNSEPCWAYGIVIIGPGFKHPEEQNVTWWYIQGIQNMTHLLKWVKQQKDHSEDLVKRIQQRIDHLAALECVVYGEGFFTS